MDQPNAKNTWPGPGYEASVRWAMRAILLMLRREKGPITTARVRLRVNDGLGWGATPSLIESGLIALNEERLVEYHRDQWLLTTKGRAESSEVAARLGRVSPYEASSHGKKKVKHSTSPGKWIRTTRIRSVVGHYGARTGG